MAHRSLADIVTELRRCVPARRRVARTSDPAALLARLLASCRPLTIEEGPCGLIVKLTAEGDSEVLLTCVLHKPLPAPLTAVEAAVAELMCAGRTLPQIAQLRGVSVNTVKSQVRQIFRKLEVDSRVALLRRLGL
jgi:DNA-binding CsgD family transcriptional regulator